MISNKKIFSGLVLIVILGVSCQKIANDKIPPVIILQGENPATVLLGCSYEDAGYIVKDDNSEAVVFVSGIINPDSAGNYYLDFTAVDADSNRSYARRRVTVQPFDINMFEGDFDVYDTLYTIPRQFFKYQASIDLFNQNPKIFRIKNFNNYGDHFRVLFEPDSSGTFLIDYSKADTTIQGNGKINCNNSGFRISYTVEIPGNPIDSHKVTFK